MSEELERWKRRAEQAEAELEALSASHRDLSKRLAAGGDSRSPSGGSLAAERERCAKIAETVKVPANGHPQIDAPTIHDARRVIAEAIRHSADE